MSLPTSFTLNNGQKIPSVALGCWMGEDGNPEDAYDMTIEALKIGYRHLDTAFLYKTEDAVGRAIRDSGVPREELFVTTKLVWKHHGSVAEGLDSSLKNLGLDYVDLYLMHWPQAMDPETDRFVQPDEHPTYVETWKAMEALLPTGKAKSIGVSNFSIKTLEVLLPQAKVVPAANQIEVHPALPWFKLVDYCKSKGIQVTAYTPLGRDPEFFVEKSPDLAAVIKSEKLEISQLLLSWLVQRGIVPIAKSQNEERLKDNFRVTKLSNKAVDALNDFHRLPGLHCTLAYDTTDGKLFGWTYDQLGWNMDAKGNVLSFD